MYPGVQAFKMKSVMKINGIVPVMLTPFSSENVVDEASLDRLIEWYLAQDCGALFAVCQSSEMQKLTLKERVNLSVVRVFGTVGRVI